MKNNDPSEEMRQFQMVAGRRICVNNCLPTSIVAFSHCGYVLLFQFASSYLDRGII